MNETLGSILEAVLSVNGVKVKCSKEHLDALCSTLGDHIYEMADKYVEEHWSDQELVDQELFQ